MREVVCGELCRYFKGRFEEPGCGGLVRLKGEGATAQMLIAARAARAGGDALAGVRPEDPRLLEVCAGCDYFVDGCDFRDPTVPRDACSPCGGLRALALLIASGKEPC